MQGKDYSRIVGIGKFVHMVYRGGDGCLLERVVLVDRLDPDGLTFSGLCLMRALHPACDDDDGRRRFRYERVRWARPWNGAMIRTASGLVKVPPVSRLLRQHAASDPQAASDRIRAACRAAWADCEGDYRRLSRILVQVQTLWAAQATVAARAVAS
jgi:hypothetical protein